MDIVNDEPASNTSKYKGRQTDNIINNNNKRKRKEDNEDQEKPDIKKRVVNGIGSKLPKSSSGLSSSVPAISRPSSRRKSTMTAQEPIRLRFHSSKCSRPDDLFRTIVSKLRKDSEQTSVASQQETTRLHSINNTRSREPSSVLANSSKKSSSAALLDEESIYAAVIKIIEVIETALHHRRKLLQRRQKNRSNRSPRMIPQSLPCPVRPKISDPSSYLRTRRRTLMHNLKKRLKSMSEDYKSARDKFNDDNDNINVRRKAKGLRKKLCMMRKMYDTVKAFDDSTTARD